MNGLDYRYDDGGQSGTAFADANRTCVVAATTVALDIRHRFTEIHDLFKMINVLRKETIYDPCNGVYHQTYYRLWKLLGLVWYPVRGNYTVKDIQRMRFLRNKTSVVMIHDETNDAHLTVLDDRCIVDVIDCRDGITYDQTNYVNHVYIYEGGIVAKILTKLISCYIGSKTIRLVTSVFNRNYKCKYQPINQ